MRIIVDAFGGDNAPLEIIQGCELAVKAHDVDILLVGKEETIRKIWDHYYIPFVKDRII